MLENRNGQVRVGKEVRWGGVHSRLGPARAGRVGHWLEAVPKLHKHKPAGWVGLLGSSEGTCEMRHCMRGIISHVAEKLVELPFLSCPFSLESLLLTPLMEGQPQRP